jgi:hypothetical protein
VARRGRHPSALGAAYQAGSTSTKPSRWCSTTSTTAGWRRLIVDHESLLGDPGQLKGATSDLVRHGMSLANSVMYPTE